MTTSNPVKSVGRRSKLLKCFKPSSFDDLDVDGPCSYFPTTYNIDSPDDDVEFHHRTRKSGYHHFPAGTIKAVFFKTSLIKKLRSRKSQQHSYGSNGNSPPLRNQSLSTLLKRSSSYKMLSEPEYVNSRTSSNRSSSLFSSSSSSSLSSDSSFESEIVVNEPDFTDFAHTNTANIGEIVRRNVSKCVNYKYYYNNYLAYILFFCLVALVFGGKYFAVVVCTSTCLYFAPSRRQ